MAQDAQEVAEATGPQAKAEVAEMLGKARAYLEERRQQARAGSGRRLVLEHAEPLLSGEVSLAAVAQEAGLAYATAHSAWKDERARLLEHFGAERENSG